MKDIEIELTGGNSNSSVVRVANTVRRSIGKSSPAVHRLLRFLADQGYQGSPRYLGEDEQGREILSYIQGSCKIDARAWMSEDILVSAATLLKGLHEATAQYPIKDGETWGYEYPDPNQHETICHNDFGLYNVVIDDNACVGVIDFDLAGPGPRIRDVAYAAYWFVPISQRALDMKSYAIADVENGCRRLKRFCNICGVNLDLMFLQMISEVLHDMADENLMIRQIGTKQTAVLKSQGHLDHWSGEALAFDRYQHTLAAIL